MGQRLAAMAQATMTPTVSIVMPFLDAAPHLEAAIASTLGQTFTGWELLLIDDGSSDGSEVMAADAARVDLRIRLLHQPPGSSGNVAAARNRGLREARGSFVAFLDADDVYEPKKLASQLRDFEDHPEVAMVYGPSHWWHPGAEHRDFVDDVRAVAGRVHRPPALLGRVLVLQRGQVPCTCGVLIRSDALRRVGGFDESFDLYEDQTLWAKLMLRYPVYVTNQVGARYRQHAGSTSARSVRDGRYDRMRPHESRLAFLEWVGHHARSSGLSDPSLERALRLALAPYPDRGAPVTGSDRWVRAWWHFGDRLRGVPRRVARRLRALSGSARAGARPGR